MRSSARWSLACIRAGSDAEAEGTLRTFGVASLAAAEVPALAGATAAFLTGDMMSLAFAVPLFAFAWLTWPSDDRVGMWLSMRARLSLVLEAEHLRVAQSATVAIGRSAATRQVLAYER